MNPMNVDGYQTTIEYDEEAGSVSRVDSYD
jgi:hypothetical protein